MTDGRSVAREAGFERYLLGKLVSPERRRQAVERVREEHQLSERQACGIVGQPHGTQLYTVIARADEDRLTQAILALAAQYGRYGYRRITQVRNQAGWEATAHKTVDDPDNQLGTSSQGRTRPAASAGVGSQNDTASTGISPDIAAQQALCL